MSETFESCKNKIGGLFFIEPKVDKANWLPEQPFILLRFRNPYLTFYKKRGSTEVRYDLKEIDFSFYKIIETYA